MKVKLKDIASVQMGYSFRSRLESINDGTVVVIQMKDLTDNNIVDICALTFINMEIVAEKHLVKPGDLIFRSRGLVSTSAILEKDPGAAVVAAPLFRIRLTDARVLPAYLNWYISQSPAQSYFSSHAKGTAQRMISKDVLENLEIFIPSFAKQKAVVALASLAEEEQQIMKKLSERRKQYISQSLIHISQGAKP